MFTLIAELTNCKTSLLTYDTFLLLFYALLSKNLNYGLDLPSFLLNQTLLHWVYNPYFFA